jgi:hypothetical protein
MISIIFGKIKKVTPPFVDVILYGFKDHGVFKNLSILMLGGQTSESKSWIAPRIGDKVAVLYDSITPENSIVLGGVYAQNDSLPVDPDSSASFEFDNLNIKSGLTKVGSDLNGVQFAARADHCNSELQKINSELNSVAVCSSEVVRTLLTQVIVIIQACLTAALSPQSAGVLQPSLMTAFEEAVAALQTQIAEGVGIYNNLYNRENTDCESVKIY